MSSSTSSSNAHRTYVLGVLLLAFVPAAAFFATGLYLQPLDGDLTRIGAHAEREYGWNSPQTVFQQPLYTIGAYTEPHDMVVVGDSFATAMPAHQWQNHLVATTGLSLATLSSYATPIEQVLQNNVFVSAPPRFFILNYVERHLPSQLGTSATCDSNAHSQRTMGSQPPSVAPPISIPAIETPKILHRQTQWTSWQDVKLAYAAKHVIYGFARKAFDHEPTKALRVGLTRDDLFTNANPTMTLVFSGDLEKTAQWKTPGLTELNCKIERLRGKVEANGHTKFILMVAPDKLTAYSPWARNPQHKGLSALGELSQMNPAVMPRIDRALIEVIGNGHKDVYLPNNTHWGSTGHLVAAQALIDFLALSKRP